jgi:5'-phosphate synthase pdxT subunit
MMSENTGDTRTKPLKLMNFTAKRNAYGRQLGSFSVNADFKGIGNIPMVFIRAPYISEASDNVDILAVVDDRIVAARQGKFLVTAFHPELTKDVSVHKYFLDMI